MRPRTLRNELPRLAALAAFLTFVLLVVAAGCASATTGIAALAGRYELRSVNGKSVPVDALGGAIRGELVLTADGRAARTVTYARSGLPDPVVFASSGTYRVRGSEITLRLPDRGEVRGEIRSSSIVVGYPGPGGRWIEEEYVRVGAGKGGRATALLGNSASAEHRG
jgi:hypothetical protein